MARPVTVAPERLAAIYTLYQPRILRYVATLVRLGDRADVEDLTADTFIQAWRWLDTAKSPDDQLHGWLRTIARHTVGEHYRRARHTREFTTGDTWRLDAAAHPVPSVEDTVLVLDRIRAALHTSAAA